MGEHHLEERLFNLENNYQRYDGNEEEIYSGPECIVVRHYRRFGQVAHYAVIGGIPIAYCVGHDVVKPSGRRFIVTSTFVHPDHRGKGIGSTVYRAIIDDGIILVSDWDLSDGAKALWASLMRDEPRRDVIHFKDGYVAKRRQTRIDAIRE